MPVEIKRGKLESGVLTDWCKDTISFKVYPKRLKIAVGWSEHFLTVRPDDFPRYGARPECSASDLLKFAEALAEWARANGATDEPD